jgi:hypothetical protein
MLRTWVALECEACHAQFPRSHNGVTTPLDAAMESLAVLRTEAKKCGWQRYQGRDFCSQCEKPFRTALKGGR